MLISTHFISHDVRKVREEVCLAGRYKGKSTETNNGEGLHTIPVPARGLAQARNGHTVSGVKGGVLQPYDTGTTEEAEVRDAAPEGPLNNPDKKGNRHSTRQGQFLRETHSTISTDCHQQENPAPMQVLERKKFTKTWLMYQEFFPPAIRC